MFGAVAACRTLLTLPLHPVYRSAAGVPDERQFLSLILTIRQHNNMIKKAVRNPGPLLSHCSAGIGRTGTFLVIDIVLEAIEQKGACVRVCGQPALAYCFGC